MAATAKQFQSFSENKVERLRQLKHWRSQSLQRREHVLEQRGAQFSSAFGLEFPLPPEPVAASYVSLNGHVFCRFFTKKTTGANVAEKSGHLIM